MKLQEAILQFDAAEAHGFEPARCAAGRWECHMLRGDFTSAWKESDRISAGGTHDPHRFWDGEPIDGKRVLIRCLHGLGDTIQFIRYARRIRECAAHLVIEAQPKLKGLLACSGLADEVITWGEREPPWDQQIEVNELAGMFRATVSTIPDSVPYLKAPSAHAAARFDGTRLFRAGLVWKASIYDPSRSVPLNTLAPLLATNGVQFYSLQGELDCTELNGCSKRIEHLDEGSLGLLATADHAMQMDLVITVDTMMAHLAGALARPVWSLLPFRCDWRWMADRDDSPWYPTMTLFRQPAPGRWDEVVERVRKKLAEVVHGGNPDGWYRSEAAASRTQGCEPDCSPGRVKKNFEPCST